VAVMHNDVVGLNHCTFCVDST